MAVKLMSELKAISTTSDFPESECVNFRLFSIGSNSEMVLRQDATIIVLVYNTRTMHNFPPILCPGDPWGDPEPVWFVSPEVGVRIQECQKEQI